MASIEQIRTPVKVSGGLAYHYSWVKKDDKGEIIDRYDCWPTKPDGNPDMESTGYGKPLKVHSNQPMKGEPEPMGAFTGTQAEIDNRWAAGEAARHAIDANPPSYRPMDDLDLETKDPIPATNSNSVHATIGKAMGFDTSEHVGGSAPGMNRQLLPDDFTPPGQPLLPATLTRPGQSVEPPKAAPQQQEQNGNYSAPTTPAPLPQGRMSDEKQQEQGVASPEPTPEPAQKPADPQVAALVEMAGKPIDNPGKAALLKPVEKLTQPEMTDMINHAQGDYRGHRSGDPLKAHTYEKVQDWHVAMYGDAPQGNDGGKPIEPAPIRAIPDQPAHHAGW